MKTDRIYEGNVICDNMDKGKFVFIKIGERFVFLDEVNNLIDLLKIGNGMSNIIMFDTDKTKRYYIDEETLKPYYEKNSHKTLKRIKFDYLLDPRSPIGIQADIEE